jgi:hypothetical protein
MCGSCTTRVLPSRARLWPARRSDAVDPDRADARVIPPGTVSDRLRVTTETVSKLVTEKQSGAASGGPIH